MNNIAKESSDKDANFGKLSKQIKIALLVVLVFAIVIISVALTLYLKHFDGDFSPSNSDWGTFGDFFGGTLNPILSFLGLIALLLTIVLQSSELELTRLQLEKSAQALSDQLETQTKQRFENTFFSLLDQHNKILEQLTTTKKIRNQETSELRLIVHDLVSKFQSLYNAKNILMSENDICGHYFRVLYQILKFIATNIPQGKIGHTFLIEDISKNPLAPDEKMYSNIVRSFLNLDVTLVLAVNCYCPNNEKDTYWKYKLLLERYGFLEHLHMSDLHPIYQEIAGYYKESAFAENFYMTSRKALQQELEMK